MWGTLRIAIAVAEPNPVTCSQHDVIGAGSAHHRLVEVVAHRVVISEQLEIGRIALEHVVEAHRGGTFFGRCVVEIRRLRLTIRSSAYRHFDPGPEVVAAPGGIFLSFVSRGAIELLPHLVEAMDRAVGVRVVRKRLRGQLERAVGQMVGIGDPRIKRAVGKPRAAGGQVLVIVVGQAIFHCLGSGHAGKGCGGVSAGERRR